MSWLQKLNPIDWIKSALISDFVGGKLRHFISFICGAIAMSGVVSLEHSEQLNQVLTAIVTDPRFISGIIGLIGTFKLSAENKKSE